MLNVASWCIADFGHIHYLESASVCIYYTTLNLQIILFYHVLTLHSSLVFVDALVFDWFKVFCLFFESNCTVVPYFFVSLCVSLKLFFWVESFAFHSHMYLVELLWDILLCNFCERKRISRDLGLKNKNQWTKLIPETSEKKNRNWLLNQLLWVQNRKKERNEVNSQQYVSLSMSTMFAYVLFLIQLVLSLCLIFVLFILF